MFAMSPNSHTIRLLLIIASIVIVVAGMRAFSDTLNAFFMAALIAILCTPIQSRLRARGWSQGLSLALILALIVVIGIVLVAFIGISTNQVYALVEAGKKLA